MFPLQLESTDAMLCPTTLNESNSLMEASAEQRIRLLAIAIQGMDPDDGQRLLEYMPIDYGQRIRYQIDKLDEVSSQEREYAIRTIEQLIQSPEALTTSASNMQAGWVASPIGSVVSSIGPDTPGVSRFAEGFEDYPIEAVLRVLSGERPIVIASLLNRLPSRLGQLIVPRLDLELAKAALDWIPKLVPADPSVMDGVLAEFEAEVHRVGKILQSKHHGEEKARQLRAVLEPEISVQDCMVSMDPNLPALPSMGSVVGGSSKTSMPRPFVIPLSRKSDRESALEVMLKLDDLDLLQVLYSHQAQDVKRFLAGANKALRLRVERLTPSAGLKKLRMELSSVPICDEKTWLQLASLFVQTAMELEQNQSASEQVRISA